MSREVPGGSKPLRRWEKYYWGVGVTGVALFLYNTLKKPEKTPEEIAVWFLVCGGCSSDARSSRRERGVASDCCEHNKQQHFL